MFNGRVTCEAGWPSVRVQPESDHPLGGHDDDDDDDEENNVRKRPSSKEAVPKGKKNAAPKGKKKAAPKGKKKAAPKGESRDAIIRVKETRTHVPRPKKKPSACPTTMEQEEGRESPDSLGKLPCASSPPEEEENEKKGCPRCYFSKKGCSTCVAPSCPIHLACLQLSHNGLLFIQIMNPSVSFQRPEARLQTTFCPLTRPG